MAAYGLVAVGALLLFGSGGGDDSHITWWVVDELRRTGRILNYNGAALEQSSSLGLVLVVAALRWVIPLATPALGVVVSLLATSATCWMASRVARRLRSELAPAAALLIATSGPLMYWGTSGMETALDAFATVWLFDALGAQLELATPPTVLEVPTSTVLNLLAACSLFVTVRPENPLLLCGLLGGSAGLYGLSLLTVRSNVSRLDWRVLGQAALVCLVPVVTLFAFRHRLFHEWFPHPVAAKAGGDPRWAAGWKYLIHHALDFQPALLALLPASAASLVGWFLLRRANPLAAMLAVYCALGVAFICGSGGDWMSCGRFLAQHLAVWWLAVLACASLALGSRTKWLAAFVLALAAANLTYLAALARGSGTNGYPVAAALRVVPAARRQYALERYSFLELSNKSHLRDALLAEELKRVVAQVATALPGKIWLASGQAGAVPYHVFEAFPGRLRFLDFWGLTSSEVKPCLPASRLRHSSLGVAMTPELVFEFRDAILRDCGVPPPDIVFNTTYKAGTKRGLEARGYRVVYFQEGAMPSFSPPSSFRGGTSMDAYIAVRRSLADQLQLQYHEVHWKLSG